MRPNKQYVIDYTADLTDRLVAHFGLIAADSGPHTVLDVLLNNKKRQSVLLTPQEVVDRAYEIAMLTSMRLTALGHITTMEIEDGPEA